MAEIFINTNIPLEQTDWRNEGETFSASQGELEINYLKFASSNDGNIWNIHLVVDGKNHFLAVFCLGVDPKEWSTQIAGNSKIPSDEVISITHSIIQEIQQDPEISS